MIYYGKREEAVRGEALAAELVARAEGLAGAAGFAEDSAVGLLLRAGQGAQALLDAAFQRRGCDGLGGEARSIHASLVALGTLASGGAPASSARARVAPIVRRLARSGALRLRTPEGFAWYGLHPRLFSRIGALLANARPIVVGVRSAGLVLGAAAAAAAQARAFLSVRPFGDPFARRINLSLQARRLFAETDAPVLIVDEGPGLSGSSFLAVVDALEACGVAPARIILAPSHEGEPGGACSPENRTTWRALRRLVGTADDDANLARIAAAFAQDGAQPAPLRDLSAGRWRALAPDGESLPAQPGFERRKVLAQTADGRVVLRFVGHGAAGERTHARAAALSCSGFTPRIGERREGYLAQKWVDGERLEHDAFHAPSFLDRLAEYLAWRTQHLETPPEGGAGAAQLAAMVETNMREACGAAPDVESLQRRLAQALLHARPSAIDGRLHRWEWISAGGRILKTDAFDHCAGHDLIGAQDVAWDVAGAIVEFGLDAVEGEALRAAVEARGARASADLAALFVPCYAAFQLGAWTMAGAWAGSAEKQRLGREVARYVHAARVAADKLERSL